MFFSRDPHVLVFFFLNFVMIGMFFGCSVCVDGSHWKHIAVWARRNVAVNIPSPPSAVLSWCVPHTSRLNQQNEDPWHKLMLPAVVWRFFCCLFFSSSSVLKNNSFTIICFDIFLFVFKWAKRGDKCVFFLIFCSSAISYIRVGQQSKYCSAIWKFYECIITSASTTLSMFTWH